MKTATKFFPEGIALGEAFLNRQEECKYLISRIKANKHSVLMAPRRYGKTSLVLRVASEMKIPYCAMDLLAAYSEEYVRDQIISKVGGLVFELLPKINKAKEKLIAIFKQMKPEITLDAFGQRLVLKLSNKPLQDISETLLKLDETANHFNKKAVIFMDEFQQISKLANSHSLEASIRHAVERSENISYVFSGSNRSLLNQMFGDQSRPLYRLCQTISITRMPKEIYVNYFSACAAAKWKNSLSANSLEKIFELTELHPFYINVLCQLLWEESTPPSEEKIITLWHEYVKTQKHIISHDITELSANQRKLITALAKTPTKEVQAVEFLTPLKISSSSARQALEVLLRADLVHRDAEGSYRILDPAMRYYLDVVLWESWL